MRHHRRAGGFVLPTVVITSVVLFAVLAAVVGIVSSTQVSLDAQFYESLAADAAESGSTHADSCLQDNNFVSAWGASALHPNTSCSGGAACTNIASCFVVSTPQYRSSYTVGTVQNPGNGVQVVTVTGTVQLLRANGDIWNTYTKVLNIRVGAQIASSQVALGYVGSTGGFFATVRKDGTMWAAGYNGYGQLGNGTIADTTIPTKFTVPTTTPIVAAYTSFLSVGKVMFAVDRDGIAYGAGHNENGDLGVGSISSSASPNITTPQKVQLPAGVRVQSVMVGGGVTYFLGSDNKVYATGACSNGLLGYNYTVTGCADKGTPVVVSLPAPNVSNPNTIPVEIVSDRIDTYVRMAGGAVYGWGGNDYGQLGTADVTVAQSAPVKIGTFGDVGQPRAVQITHDGSVLAVLDSAGQVYTLGANNSGQAGTNESAFYFYPYAGGLCLQATSATVVARQSCNGAASQLFQIRADKTLYNAALNACLFANTTTTLQLGTCAASNTKYQFTYTSSSGYSSIQNVSTGTCIIGSGATYLGACGGPSQIKLVNIDLVKVDQSSVGTVTKIQSDAYSLSMLTSTGQIWSIGTNTYGQFGNGTTGNWYPTPVKFNTATQMTDIYETNDGGVLGHQNLYGIGSDGRVYGAGGNADGQLGDGTTTDRSSPVVMSGINGTSIAAVKVQSGFGATVITTSSGTLYTVGNNDNGQLGDGTTISRSTPIYSKYLNPQNAIAY